jgi:flagellar biosynthesis chaperone FliJ
VKSPPSEGAPPEEHEDEVDSTSECDSEYSIPPAKRPGISNFLSDRRDSEEKVDGTNVFGSLKSLTSEIENKYKSVLSENQKLRHKVPILEKENRDLKNTKRELEAKRVAEWSNYSRAIEKMKDSLKEAQDTIANQKRQLQDKDTRLKKEQIENERLKRNVQGVLNTFQSALDDTYREENWKVCVY